MNSFNKNKKIVEICKHYYKIANVIIYDYDKVTSNIIKMYEEYIFSRDLTTQTDIDKLTLIDNIMYKFITDSRFKKELCEYFTNLKVSKVSNLVEYVINKMIEFFNEYKDIYTRNIYIPRWI